MAWDGKFFPLGFQTFSDKRDRGQCFPLENWYLLHITFYSINIHSNDRFSRRLYILQNHQGKSPR